MPKYVLYVAENIMGERENADNNYFLLLLQCFQKWGKSANAGVKDAFKFRSCQLTFYHTILTLNDPCG